MIADTVSGFGSFFDLIGIGLGHGWELEIAYFSNRPLLFNHFIPSKYINGISNFISVCFKIL